MPTITDLTGPAGALEATLERPASGRGDQQVRAAVVFAHPHPQYGGTMHTKAVYQGAKGLARIGCAVLRFNFRGVGRSAGEFDRGEGELADFSSALDYMAARYPEARLWSAGFSFGAWVALEAGAVDPRVSALIGIAPPVATSASGMSYEFPNTLASTKAKFFVQGEADEVCPLEALWQFYGRLEEPKEMVVIDGADHLFEGRTAEVGEALEDLLGDY
ncbi:MAG TPA: alpha/beta fold hydrolase [Vicinamibacterales bacterium]|nr:alpha/beta fold hydrolase [Vicinamibacterales bacterium]